MKGINSPLSTPADLTGSPKLYSPLILQSLEILFQPTRRPRQEGGWGKLILLMSTFLLGVWALGRGRGEHELGLYSSLKLSLILPSETSHI